ncbi:hypothetical protein UY3_17478 [Chelonia mydas]|uniref:Uncharacterized protein n=1 Tax=Chelonia mydas TaxID=8469 RepID=M7B068_CHEMY|nr:hypothetical protein UY3_17478 [Chelonia mydas]
MDSKTRAVRSLRMDAELFQDKQSNMLLEQCQLTGTQLTTLNPGIGNLWHAARQGPSTYTACCSSGTRSLVQLYKLCNKQLSSQFTYDFTETGLPGVRFSIRIPGRKRTLAAPVSCADWAAKSLVGGSRGSRAHGHRGSLGEWALPGDHAAAGGRELHALCSGLNCLQRAAAAPLQQSWMLLHLPPERILGFRVRASPATPTSTSLPLKPPPPWPREHGVLAEHL